MRNVSPFGHQQGTMVGGVWTPTPHSVADLTALKAIAAADRVNGQLEMLADGSFWRFHSTSAVTGDDQLVATPAAGSGRWLRCPGVVDLALPIAFGTTDAAVLYTMPTGSRLHLRRMYWEVTADWTGGSSSAIGVSSTKTGYSTKGDLLGGASGDVLATLVASVGIVPGTVGVKMDTDAELHANIWLPTDIFRFDRITSAFTAGSGFVHVVGDLLKNAGA